MNKDNPFVEKVSSNGGVDKSRCVVLAQEVDAAPYRCAVVGEALYDLLADNVILYDSEGCITHIGNMVNGLLALDLHQSAEMQVLAWKAIHFIVRDKRGSALPEEAGPIQQILRGETLRSENAVEVYACRSDGDEIRLCLYGAPLRDERGRLAGAIVIVQEHTERPEGVGVLAALNEVEQELLQASRSIRGYQNAVTEGVSAFAPLDALVGTAKSAEAQGPGDKAMKDLVRERIETISALFDPTWLDLNALIIDAVARLLPTAMHHGLHWQLAHALPLLWGDRDRLVQVFFCLISNAIKYSPAGSEVYITTAIEGQRVHVSIRDQGVGSTISELQYLLQGYTRKLAADLPRDLMLEGGLPLVCTIIHMHGGRVWIENSPHKGFILHFTLPFPALPVHH